MKQVIFTIAIALLTGACALTTAEIDVPYQPTEKPAVIDGASSATVDVVSTDGRTSYRDRVGSKKNRYGMEMAAIVATNNIPKTVGDSVKPELSQRGYNIGPDHAQVSVEVVKFYNDFKTGFFSGDAYSEVAFNVKVMRPDKTLAFSKYFDGNGTAPNIQLANGSNAREALIIAFRNAIHSVVNDPDLLKALSDAPQPVAAHSGQPGTS